MPKRGQVTVFIIVGIVLIAVSALMYGMISRAATAEKTELFIVNRAPVLGYVEKCLAKELENTILFVSAQGGFYSRPASSVSIPLVGLRAAIDLPLYEENATFPSEEHLENEIAAALRTRVDACFNFSSFPMPITSAHESRVEVDADTRRVSLSLFHPTTIFQGENFVTLDYFTAESRLPLVLVHEAAYAIAKDSSCVSCLDEILPEGFLVQETVFLMNDSAYSVRTLRNEELAYSFAQRLSYVQPLYVQPLPSAASNQTGEEIEI